MPAEFVTPAAHTFRELLAAAITAGRRPHPTSQLGPASWAAIDALAREHPDATPDHVVAAHDAFTFEHTDDPRGHDLDPMTAQATEYALFHDFAPKSSVIERQLQRPLREVRDHDPRSGESVGVHRYSTGRRLVTQRGVGPFVVVEVE